MQRRIVLTGVLALTMTAAPVAALAQAAPDRKAPVPAAKLFPYLDRYLKLPPAERTLFAFAYTLTRDGAPARDLKMWLVEGQRREPLSVGIDGRLARLPTLDQLKSAKVEIDAPESAKMGVRMSIVATARPASEMNAAELAGAVNQANAGVRKAAGLLRVAVPHFERVVFVGAAKGQAIAAGGALTPLPGTRAPYADLTILSKSQFIRLDRTPTALLLAPAAKR